jgi:glycosyltransferase involved in cell wall biosynthesis
VTTAASIVVPTFRRNDMLRRCLEALVAQDCQPSYEIIVADDAAHPDTQRFVDGFASRQSRPIRYVAVRPKHGPAAARNAGWQAARGTVIAFTDDDCLPAPSWLRNGLSAIGEAAAATGAVVVPLRPRPTDYERDCAGLSRGEFVTANCFCRREVLQQLGGFDEQFTTAWREDSDLHFTLLERGHAIIAAPEAVVVHPVRPAYWGVSLAQQRKTAFNARLFKKHRRLYRERLARSPRRYYAITAALGGILIGLAAGTPPLAVASAGCWTALTGHFCTERLRGTSHSPTHVAEMLLTSAIIPPLSLYWRIRGAVRYRVLFF